jgi:hypothetical protein
MTDSANGLNFVGGPLRSGFRTDPNLPMIDNRGSVGGRYLSGALYTWQYAD